MLLSLSAHLCHFVVREKINKTILSEKLVMLVDQGNLARIKGAFRDYDKKQGNRNPEVVAMLKCLSVIFNDDLVTVFCNVSDE